jgi:hypothetical protein
MRSHSGLSGKDKGVAMRRNVGNHSFSDTVTSHKIRTVSVIRWAGCWKFLPPGFLFEDILCVRFFCLSHVTVL